MSAMVLADLGRMHRYSAAAPVSLQHVVRLDMHSADSINGLIAGGHLSTATDRLVLQLEQAPSDVELLRLSRELSARLRSRCMDLACNKATDGSAEARECEELLRRVIALNGEGTCG